LETEPENTVTILLTFINSISIGVLIAIAIVIILILLSALISGSEVALFSLTPKHKAELIEHKTKNIKLLISLLHHPEKLLATILIANNLVNVGVVIISTFITNSVFNFDEYKILGFIIQVILITGILLLFGEIFPKVFAARFPLQFSKLITPFIYVLNQIFTPISLLLIKSSSLTKNKLAKKENFSIDDLSKALDLSESIVKEDKDILKGIATFRHSDAKAVMKSRMDVVAIEYNTDYYGLLKIAVEEGYSRIPVYEDNFDNIKGIIYIKDLLPFLKKDKDFAWQKLIRDAFFIPETKKINVLLEEFRAKKIHFAIVIDEYGGKSGIVTLEDILEEIVGEIHDETDEDQSFYSKIDENTFIFDAKTSLNDFEKIAKIKEEVINLKKGDAETLAGLILELKGEMPKKEEEIVFKNMKFKILEVDNRRIISIKVTKT